MKRIRVYLMTLAAVVLTCCSEDSEVSAQTVESTGKTLVVYYSYTGNCEQIVETLAGQIQADVMRIEPADKTQRYEANNYAIGTELLNTIKAAPNEATSYPAIDPVSVEDLSPYQNIIVVTPLWWSQMAAIMQTYLFNHSTEMSEKHVALIVSSHSSSIGGVVSDAKRLLPGVVWAGDALWINNSNHSARASMIENWLKTLNLAKKQTIMGKMYINIGSKTLPVVLDDNSATEALTAALQEGDIAYEANDYGGFEKVGSIGSMLPTEDAQTTTQPGDVVLYNGSQIVLFYGSNTWSYTRLGRIEYTSAEELEAFLKAGQGNVVVRLSASSAPTAISVVRTAVGEDVYYTMNGQRAYAPRKGLFIKNGKKVVL
ncbi:MAG: hypothetical protein II951_05585 [Bacteroidales bacterium]|nr:hypothetical protein [Bacteroidales bacterium]